MADNTESTEALKTRIKELEYEKLLKPLESRIQNIEKVLWVLGALAIIFGASGGWGLSALREARNQLAELQKGAQGVQEARSAAVKAVNDEKDAQLASFRAQANGIAHEAVNGEVQGQISAVKKWTAFIYGQAHDINLPEGSQASGYWQKVLKDASPRVQQELK